MAASEGVGTFKKFHRSETCGGAHGKIFKKFDEIPLVLAKNSSKLIHQCTYVHSKLLPVFLRIFHYVRKSVRFFLNNS